MWLGFRTGRWGDENDYDSKGRRLDAERAWDNIAGFFPTASLVAAVAVRWKSHVWFKDTGMKKEYVVLLTPTWPEMPS